MRDIDLDAVFLNFLLLYDFEGSVSKILSMVMLFGFIGYSKWHSSGIFYFRTSRDMFIDNLYGILFSTYLRSFILKAGLVFYDTFSRIFNKAGLCGRNARYTAKYPCSIVGFKAYLFLIFNPWAHNTIF